MYKSGFVSIVGRPNAGKSSLLNQLVGEKIAIVTDKPQTTRDAIIGVRTADDHQIIYIDTPGIHKPKHELGQRMNFASYQHFKGVDIIYYMMDGSQELGKGDRFVMKRLKETKIPVFLLINKTDLMTKESLHERITELSVEGFSEIIPISVKENSNLLALLNTTLTYLEEGPQYYPADQVSAYPQQFIISEIIREKIIELTQEEIPHSVAVAIESIRHKDKVTVISAVIFVNRASQKGMIIGKQGKMIREIGQRAREELETLLQRKVFLETHVRVEEDWRNRQKMLNQLGYVIEEND
ncbi:MAG TPA: GTPase Era [Erysipelothrix sp.]